MPSPLGHALAGMAVAWSAEAIRRHPCRVPRSTTLAVTCAALAVAPDLDLLYPPIHRTMTHSLFATLLVGGAVAIVKWRQQPELALGVATACLLAYGSHPLLDWLGGDTKLPAGIQLFWPFSGEWFISRFGVFQATDIGRFFEPAIMRSNALAVLRELAMMIPIALAAFVWRHRRLRPGPGE